MMWNWRTWLLTVCLLPVSGWASEYFEQLGWIAPDSKLTTLINYQPELEQLYQRNGNQLIWFDLQQGSSLEFQLEVIQRAGFSPLFARQLSYLQYYRKSNRWYEYDLLATDTLLLYLNYAEKAKTEGKDWFFGKKLKHPVRPVLDSSLLALERAISSHQLASIIETYTPDSSDYKQLIESYLALIKFQKLERPLYTQDGLKREGDTLENRDILLSRMDIVDVDLGEVRRDITWYDDTLESAVKQFQRLHGLTPDGVIGPKTIKWLNLPIDKRLGQLALNAERARYWPENRDTIIVVNLPSYDMKYWFDGKEVFESKVVVGKKARPTPVMVTNLNALILNPTWNVPWKIMVEDIIPKVKNDPMYLYKQNIEILPKWGSSERIDPTEIDWASVKPKAFPYRMTQRSGYRNALGLYKFNTPNNRAIYLHDTPSKSLFRREQRAFSSGCIRVENADVFANRLLSSQGISTNKVAEANDQSNKAIPLRKRVPVHIIYQTAWFEGGKTHYREDIYRLDSLSHSKG